MSRALDLLHALVIDDDGRRWGEVAVDVQRECAEAVLEVASLTPFHFWTRARAWSKTTDLAGIAVAAMLTQAPRGARLYAGAADRDQARLFLDSCVGFEARTPELRGALKIDAYRVTALRSGASLEILAADAPGSWGLRPWMLLLDELAQWPTTIGARTFLEALLSASGKVPGARVVCLTTAGDPAHPARKLLDHAIADPLWRVHEVAGPPPWMDPGRIEEQRRRLPESSYQRLFENRWVAAEDRLVDPDDLAACVTLDGPLSPETGRRYVLALDVGLVKDRTAALVAHTVDVSAGDEGELAKRVVVDRLEVWQGRSGAAVQLEAVEDWVETTCRLYNNAEAVFDPYQSVQLGQRLRARGLRVTDFAFSSQSVGRLALTLHELLRSRRLSLPDDEALLDELRNVRLVERTPGVYRIDHDPDRHDDRVIALALAAQQLLEARPGTLTASCSQCGAVKTRGEPHGPGCVFGTGREVLRVRGLTFTGPNAHRHIDR